MKAATIEFGILGPIEVAVDGRALTLAGAKLRTLLAVLLLAEGHSRTGQQLILELWGEEPPPTATAALQVYLSGLRKLLGDRLRRVGSGYLLETKDAEVDAARFVTMTAEAGTQLQVRPAEAVNGFTAALALWRGEPLSDTSDTPSVLAARIQLEERRLSAIEDRARAQLGLGRHNEVVNELLGFVAANPTRERLVGQLMIALYRCGRDSDATRTYAALENALRTHLGVQPSAETSALAAAIRRHDPTISAPSMLPIPATRFVGRRQELDHLEVLLGANRLLTLVGAGGSGKTRLALQLSRDIGAVQHPDGVHFVELAGPVDDGSVLAQIASTIDLRELPGEALLDSVVARLRNARALLVLDNCEHVASAVHAVVPVLLARCSALRILATSRGSLGVEGEHLVPVGGLSLPAEGDRYEIAVRADAVRLLGARAAAARSGFRIDEATIGSAVAVCRRLDGLPLAIELAAARLRVLSLGEIEQRLDRQLSLLSNVSPAAPDRHRTIRATIDWSYDLLDPEERVLFARLGAFVNGCTLEAAEYVGRHQATDPEDAGATIVDTLARLVDRSMLVPEHSTDSTRFRMLETIREYAHERLVNSAESGAVQARHAAYCRALIESAPQFGGDDHALWMRRFGTELDNFRAAMEWAVTQDPVHEDALAIATPLWWYWWASGQMREGKQWLLRILDASQGCLHPLRGAALRAAAALARNSGELTQARALGERALVAHQELGDPKGLAMAWNNLCMTATGQRDFEAALEYVQQSGKQAEAIGDPRGLAVAANNGAIVLRCMGRLDEAASGFEDALDRFRSLGDVRGEAAAVGNIGVVARRRGNSEMARRMALDSLRRYHELDLEEGELDALEALACLDVAQDRPAAALGLLLLADRERRALGAPIFVPDESDDRDAALQSARSTLDPTALADISAAVGSLDLSATVRALLL